MKITYEAGPPGEMAGDSLVMFLASPVGTSDSQLRELDSATGGAVTTLLDSEEFAGNEGDFATLYRPDGFAAQRVILAGIGEKKEMTADTFRRVLGRLSRYRGLNKSRSVVFHFDRVTKPEYFQAAIEGYLLGSFVLLDFKSDQKKTERKTADQVVFASSRRQALRSIEKAVSRGVAIAEGQIMVRSLAYTPANHLTPSVYAEKVRDLARAEEVSCKILDEKAIEREKMGALLSVSRGSVEPPRFVVLQYNGGPGGQRPIVLVGKGVTFDSGGISIKPSAAMHEMKQDMTGSAVVIGTILTAARLGVNRNIVALTPLTENMPSGTATKPGDVVTSRKGLTIEVINTDAEGRLILADALDYANKFNPQAVIDVATLTGATLHILGYLGAPVMGNHGRLIDMLLAASETTAERIWELPLWKEYHDLMKSDVADLVNSGGGRQAGTLKAGAFLEEFIGDWPWAHLDIGSVDWQYDTQPYSPKGATGFGMRLLVELLSNWKKV